MTYNSDVTIAAALANVQVGTVLGKAVTRGELSQAFDLVANRDNWKMPIDATVWLDDWQKACVHEAVIFFTGSIPRFHWLAPRQYRVVAAGYYATIGA